MHQHNLGLLRNAVCAKGHNSIGNILEGVVPTDKICTTLSNTNEPKFYIETSFRNLLEVNKNADSEFRIYNFLI